MKDRIFSVSQINAYIHRLFEGDYALKRVRLQGEVSNCKYHSSGHIYFSLKDERSRIPCVMFARDRARGLPFRLENGQSVIASGSVSVYEQGGSYQLYVREVSLSGTGELYIRFEKLKRDLYERGYFDFERKKPLPRYPEKIGIVTASTGAAIRDITSIAARRNPYVQLYLYPARVQGEGAARSIASGIRFLDRFGVDLMIIGRGGGSIEDLWAFNEIEVADAIYEAKTPIISGTGHEVDTTIADYCADVRAATPSAACELAVPDLTGLLTALDNMRDSMQRSMTDRLRKLSGQADILAGRLDRCRPERRIREQRLRLDQLGRGLVDRMQQKLLDRNRTYELYLEKISLLSPASRLKGGYSFARSLLGRPLHSVSQLEPGRTFDLVFSDGHAEVEPVRIYRDSDKV